MKLDGISLALLAALVVLAGFCWIEAARPYWYDEVFTLGAAGVFPGLDWAAIRADVHPPGHILLASMGRALADGAPVGARLVNLLALPMAGAAVWVLLQCLAWPRVALALTLVLVTQYLPLFVLEARVYLLLMAGSLLAHALLLALLRGWDGIGTAAALAAMAVFLSGLHFFGVAIAGAVLLTGLAHLLRRHGVTASGGILVLGGFGALAVLAIWVLGYANLSGTIGGKLYIRNDPLILLDFAVQVLPMVAVLLSLVLTARIQPHATAQMRANRGEAMMLLAPSLLVLGVTALISLHTPVITLRNLSVLVPGLALALAVLVPAVWLSAVAARRSVALIALAGVATYGSVARQQHQYIAATTRLTHVEACDGVPLFMISPGIVARYAEDIWGGGITRPLLPIARMSDRFDPESWGECTSLAAGWHEHGTGAGLTGFAARALPDVASDLIVLGPDGARLTAAQKITHGFVVIRSGPSGHVNPG